jgi:DNA-binding transcriptional regulator LsrR (DeoR family)
MTKNIDNDELNLMLNVVKKYYEMGMTQEQISKEEFISKFSVCRLIKKALANAEKGIMKAVIVDEGIETKITTD